MRTTTAVIIALLATSVLVCAHQLRGQKALTANSEHRALQSIKSLFGSSNHSSEHSFNLTDGHRFNFSNFTNHTNYTNFTNHTNTSNKTNSTNHTNSTNFTNHTNSSNKTNSTNHTNTTNYTNSTNSSNHTNSTSYNYSGYSNRTSGHRY